MLLAFVHQIEGAVDLLQPHRVGDEGVEWDLARLDLLHVAGQLGAAPHTAEGRAAPDPAGHQLERDGC